MKIDHVTIWCKDIDEMRDFYETYFLGESTTIKSNDNEIEYILTFPKSDFRLKLQTNVEVTKFHKDKRYGLSRIGFLLDSHHAVDELTELIKNGGYKIFSVPKLDQNNKYTSSVVDVEGNVIQLTSN